MCSRFHAIRRVFDLTEEVQSKPEAGERSIAVTIVAVVANAARSAKSVLDREHRIVMPSVGAVLRAFLDPAYSPLLVISYLKSFLRKGALQQHSIGAILPTLSPAIRQSTEGF